MADDLDGQRTQLMVLAVGKRLGRCYDDRLSRMDAERVEVLHVADRDTVVVTVAYNLIFNLFPTLQALLDKHLWRE